MGLATFSCGQPGDKRNMIYSMTKTFVSGASDTFKTLFTKVKCLPQEAIVSLVLAYLTEDACIQCLSLVLAYLTEDAYIHYTIQ